MDHVTRATTCFRSTFNTHQCLESIFPLLIATGEYLSAHHWQASPRVLLKWCYTGPSTCNCVAAVQSQPLKGQAVICLKWQQPNFYLPAGGKKKKSSQLCTVSILTAVASWVVAFSVYLHVVLWECRDCQLFRAEWISHLLTFPSQLSPWH